MSIETAAASRPIRLDDFGADSELESLLATYEQTTTPVVYLEGSLHSWERAKSALLSLRASNIAGILLMSSSQSGLAPSPDETSRMLIFLRDWDELFLHNIVSLCRDFIPKELHKDFELEAKMELMWFREWFTASHDTRISKYPGLPWRAFIRKIVSENYLFAEQLMNLARSTYDEEQGVELRNFLRSFLRSRKKAIALFPKKWSRLQ
jgi:hypothetical protein